MRLIKDEKEKTIRQRNAEADLFYKKSDDADKAKPSQKVVRYFPDTNLGNGHDGLAKIADRHDINVQHLKLGEYVIFVNRAKTAFKMYAPNYIIVHQRLPNGARLDPRIISLIPKYFNGTKINYDGALKELIISQLSR